MLDLSHCVRFVQYFHVDNTILVGHDSPLVHQQLQVPEVQWLHRPAEFGVAKTLLGDPLNQRCLSSLEPRTWPCLSAGPRFLSLDASAGGLALSRAYTPAFPFFLRSTKTSHRWREYTGFTGSSPVLTFFRAPGLSLIVLRVKASIVENGAAVREQHNDGAAARCTTPWRTPSSCALRNISFASAVFGRSTARL